MREIEAALAEPIIILKNEKFSDTWAVWEKRRYIAGIKGAPCTGELKRRVREQFQRQGDIHLFGYTADASDIRRAEALVETYPDLNFEFPLIEKGLNKAACLAILKSIGINPPRVYAMGFKNANCIPCAKATSPAYWALVRKEFPEEFERMVKLSRSLGVRLARLKGKRIFIDEIPEDYPTTSPQAIECDWLCELTIEDLYS